MPHSAEICQSSGSRRLTCLDLPRDPIFRRPTCLNLPGEVIFRRLSCLSLPGDLHSELEKPGSQVATELGRISFRKFHPKVSPPIKIEGSLDFFFFFSSLSSLSFRWEKKQSTS